MHLLASGQFITLAVEVGKLRTGSKVKRDFLFKVPVNKPIPGFSLQTPTHYWGSTSPSNGWVNRNFDEKN